MAVESGQVVAERYRLTKPIAEGGMGTVWLVRHVELDVDMALKLIREELLGERSARVRFRREARAAAKLMSPHIVRVHDFGVFQEQPFLVMELLEGEDLRQRLARGPLSAEAALRVVEGVAAALVVSHREGVIHRDLKPSNIFLHTVGDEQVVKVLDFGIAKGPIDAELDGSSTTTQGVVGSPPYMSPEQARGDTVDHRTDLWSLSVIAYETLTKKRPFSGPFARMFSDIVLGRFKSVREHDSSLPETLDAFFERAFAKNVAARFDDAKQLASAFRDALHANEVARLARPREVVAEDVGVAEGREEATRTRAADDTRAPTATTVGSSGRASSDRWIWAAALALALGAGWWRFIRSPTAEPAAQQAPDSAAAGDGTLDVDGGAGVDADAVDSVAAPSTGARSNGSVTSSQSAESKTAPTASSAVESGTRSPASIAPPTPPRPRVPPASSSGKTAVDPFSGLPHQP